MSETTTVAAPTRTGVMKLSECKTLGQAFSCGEFIERIKAATPKHMNSDRLLRTFVQATGKQPLLMQCEIRSVIGQMLTCSALGLEINTPLGHAYLIPFKGRRKINNKWEEVYDAQLVIGYKGMVDLAFRSGHIVDVDGDVVMQGDRFQYEKGTHKNIRYQQTQPKDANGVITHAFATATTKAGGNPFEVMLWPDVLAIRNGSKGYQAAIYALEAAKKDNRPPPKSYTEAPWVKHVIPMGAKTAFNQLTKWLPMSPDVTAAVVLDAAAERGRVNYGQVIDETGNVLDAAMDGAEWDVSDGDTTYTDRRPQDQGTDTGTTTQQTTTQTTTETTGTGKDAGTKETAPKTATKAKAAAAAAAKQTPTNTRPIEDDDIPAHLRDIPPADEAGYGRAGQASQQQQQKPPAEETKPTPAATTQAKTEPPQQQTQAPSEPEVALYLSDQNGEEIQPNGFFTSAVAFAEAFIDLWRASPDIRVALVEQNADALADVRIMSQDAHEILAELDEPAEEQGAGESIANIQDEPVEQVQKLSDDLNPTMWTVSVPDNGQGRSDLPAYVNKLRLSLGSLTRPGQLDNWLKLNEPVYGRMPGATRAQIDKAVTTRRSEMGGEPAQAIDTERKKAEDRLRDFAECQTAYDVERLGQMIKTVMARWQEQRPDLFKLVNDAANARHAFLKANPPA